MSDGLIHTPAEIIRQLILNLELGEPIADPLARWTVFHSNLPELPHDAILISDTEGVLQGREHVEGHLETKYGIQVMVRSNNVSQGYIKATRIKEAFSEDVLRTEVELEGEVYLIQAITCRSPVIDVGRDTTGKRYRKTVNAIVSLHNTTPGTGSGTGSGTGTGTGSGTANVLLDEDGNPILDEDGGMVFDEE